MKRALLVGIDHYEHFSDLSGCVNDTTALRPLLERNDDSSRNFDCKVLAPVTRDDMLEQVRALPAPGATFALLYFAGHGQAVNGDVALVTTDGHRSTPGVRFGEILEQISGSRVAEVVVVILDCCFSGGAGTVPILGDGASVMRLGLSILTASRDEQGSTECAGRGVFSTYLEAALAGGAADVLGHVTVAGLYSYLSESFGAWDQRPTFKANVDRLQDLPSMQTRGVIVNPAEADDLVSHTDHKFPLDPTYEPDAGPEHEETFERLQECRAAKLLEPMGHEHMYFAAMMGLACQLTPLGKHYWHLAAAGRI
jgi:hypothetical protein